MRNALVVITALCIGSALVGCNSKNKPAPAQAAGKAPAPVSGPVVNDHNANNDVRPPVTNPQEPTWTLKFQSKCAENVEASQCLGSYGVSIQMNGNYEVGPGPKGEVRQGTLTDDDKAIINKALGSTLAQANLRAEAHDTVEQPSESEDTISLNRSSGTTGNLVKASGTDLVYQTQSAEEAKSLLAAVRGIADKYAKNFPDDCADGANLVKALIESSQKCSNDADCVYLDTSLEIVAANSSEALVTDNCSKVTPLYVGNAELVRVNKDKILSGLDSVQTACGDSIIKDGCVNSTTFALKGVAHSCQQGVCKLPTQ